MKKARLRIALHEQCMGKHTLEALSNLTPIIKTTHTRVYPNKSYLEQMLGLTPEYDLKVLILSLLTETIPIKMLWKIYMPGHRN